MKKSFTSFLLLAISTASFAQSQRLVLVEEFTQASCGPCAAQNPAFNTLLAANPTKVVSLKYQTNWPGVDPMNAQDPNDASSRVSFYGITGVPDGLVDGTQIVNDCGVYTGAPSCLSQAEINAAYAIPSPIAINVSSHLSLDNDSIYIHIVITNTTSATLADITNWKLRVAIVEKQIHFTTPPGSNGETDFYMVVRRMLPNIFGTSWTSLAAGASNTYDFNVALPTYIYQASQVAVVAFVQNKATHAVEQAGYSEYTVGISSPNSSNNFRIYPNPVSDNVTIEFTSSGNSPVKILVTDLLGRTVAENDLGKVVAGTNVSHLDLKNLPAGIYAVSVYDGEKVQQQKISILGE